MIWRKVKQKRGEKGGFIIFNMVVWEGITEKVILRDLRT